MPVAVSTAPSFMKEVAVHGFIVSGQPGAPGRILFAARAKNLWVGVGQNQRTGVLYPSISLLYPPKLTAAMLCIAKRMQEERTAPSVHIVDQGNGTSDVSVLFQMRTAVLEFLRMFATDEFATVSEALLGRNLTLWATGEAEFKNPILGPFLDLFNHKRFFKLFLVEPDATRIRDVSRTRAIWGIQLPAFSRRAPEINKALS